MTGPVREEIRRKAADFQEKYPGVFAALKACHDRGDTPEQAKHDPQVQAEAHKCGCIGLILVAVGVISIVNVLWEFFDHLKNV